MKPILIACIAAGASLFLLSACEQKNPAPTSSKKAPAAHSHGDDDHDHDDPKLDDQGMMAGHGGPVIQLGSIAIGPYQAAATRDEGAIEPGKDAPIDVTITPAEATAPPIAAVRFWIGAEDARGSVKARAEIENPAEPNRYHTHAEIPSPLPEGSRLWVEIQDTSGAHHLGSFDLNS
jgi:hypothetical protein